MTFSWMYDPGADPVFPRRGTGNTKNVGTNLLVWHFYHPQTKFAKVMFLQVSVCPRGKGACVVAGRGACVVAGGGACVVAGGGHAWLLGGVCVCWGACMVVGGICGCGGHVWLLGRHA